MHMAILRLVDPMLNAKYLLKCHTESRLRGHRSRGRCYFRVGRNTLGQSCPSLSLSKELGHVGPRRRTVRSIATFHFLRQSEVCVGPPKGIWGVTVPGPVLRFRPLVLRFRPLLLPFRGPRYGSKAPRPTHPAPGAYLRVASSLGPGYKLSRNPEESLKTSKPTWS